MFILKYLNTVVLKVCAETSRSLQNLSEDLQGTNHAWVESTLHVLDRPINFNITEKEKFINRVSDSTSHEPLRNFKK